MIKVERYANNGFVPQFQSHHLEYVDNLLLSDQDYINFLKKIKCNSYQTEILLNLKRKREKFLKENYEDFKYGIWCFLFGKRNDFELNHIKGDIPMVNYAYLPDDIDVYDCNWEKKMKLSDDFCKYQGIYVPKRSLTEIIILK